MPEPSAAVSTCTLVAAPAMMLTLPEVPPQLPLVAVNVCRPALPLKTILPPSEATPFVKSPTWLSTAPLSEPKPLIVPSFGPALIVTLPV